MVEEKSSEILIVDTFECVINAFMMEKVSQNDKIYLIFAGFLCFP